MGFVGGKRLMERRLDVSMLEPCEPLERTLETISTLLPGDYLRVMHRREPMLLYPLLDKAGFEWLCNEQGEDRYTILIWRRGDKVARAEIKSVSEDA